MVMNYLKSLKQFFPFLYILFCTGLELAIAQKKQIPDPEETEVWDSEPSTVSFDENNVPSDAIILFDGTDLSKWQSAKGDGSPAFWTINDDRSMTVSPGNGGIETIEEHGSIQLHLEWKSPQVVKGEGQGRGNSGVFFQRRYEVQILDSYNNRTYSNGQAASIYKQYIPLVNATKSPEEWQVYDIIFIQPIFDSEGYLETNGRITVFHNGVLVQDNIQLLGTTEYIGSPKTGRDQMPGDGSETRLDRKLYLQDHGDLVSFRNIWIRKL